MQGISARQSVKHTWLPVHNEYTGPAMKISRGSHSGKLRSVSNASVLTHASLQATQIHGKALCMLFSWKLRSVSDAWVLSIILCRPLKFTTSFDACLFGR